MTKEQYIKTCLDDAISALSVPNLPMSIQVGNDWIYPKVALERLKSIRDVDQLEHFKSQS